MDADIVINPYQAAIVVAVVVIAIIIIIVSLISGQRRRQLARSPLASQDFPQRWAAVEQLLAGDSAVLWKSAVVEADAVFDLALKSLGLPGKDFGERMRAARYQYRQIGQVYPAHQLRNRLVHEAGATVSQAQARQAVEQFKRGLQMLKAL